EKQFGFIPSRNADDLAAQNRKDYPQTIIMPTKRRPTPDDYAPVKRVDLTVRERLRNGEKVYPVHGLDTHHSDLQTSVITDTPHLQTSVITDTPHLQTSVLQTSVEAYRKAENAAAGTVIDCPNCGKSFKKVNRFHIFCSHSRKKREDGGNCSDEFHNKLNPERAEALKAKKRRRKV
ncbi:MAG: hypothetical protein BWK73_17745, partial [Thiothrix lacustris]